MFPLKDCQFDCPRCGMTNQANRETCIQCNVSISIGQKRMSNFRKITRKYI